MPSFAELERANARVAMRRINFALDLVIDRIAVSATDWGNWVDTYRFMQDRNPEFIKTDITNVALRQLNINVMLILDLDGSVLASKSLELKSDRPLELDLAARKALPIDFPWRANLRAARPARGLMATNRGILMLATAPVLDGNGGGPVRGMIAMGRLLSASDVRNIGAQAQADLTLLAAGAIQGREQLLESDDVTRVYRTFDDVYGRPVMTLRVDVPREVTLRGHAAVTYASICLVGAGVVVHILLVSVLNRLVLTPLAVVTRHAVALDEGKDLTTRLDLARTDEIGVLARELDRMVARVAESRTQLVDQSFQAGFAELAKGVLHNLGNAMTPLGVRLTKLGERLRDAPSADVELAAAELAREQAGSERYRDLQEFLRLGCLELGASLKDAQADVMVIQRQTTVVQTALCELMRST